MMLHPKRHCVGASHSSPLASEVARPVRATRRAFAGSTIALVVLAVATIVLHAPTTTPSTSPASQPAASRRPEARFILHADGLPRDGMWKCHPAIADVNGDGRLDLAALPRKGRGPRVWLQTAAGRWEEKSRGLAMPSSCGGGLAFGDLDGDGLTDLAVADHCFGVSLYQGDGRGGWRRLPVELQVPNPQKSGEDAAPYMGTEDVALGDIDDDGDLDVLVGASDRGGIRVFRNVDHGHTWSRADEGLPTEGFATTVEFARVDGDKHLDVVAAFEEGPRVWLGDGAGHWRSCSTGLPNPTVGGLYFSVAVGDFNEDGRPDLAAANWVDGVELYTQGESGVWLRQPDPMPELGGGAIGIGLADLNGDWRLDLVISGRLAPTPGNTFGLFALLGDGRGHFTPVRDSDLPETGLSTSWCFEFGDIDRDGCADIVAATGGVVAASSKAPARADLPTLQVWCIRGKAKEAARAQSG